MGWGRQRGKTTCQAWNHVEKGQLKHRDFKEKEENPPL